TTTRLNKVDQRHTLTIRAGINQGFMGWVCNHRSGDAAGCADRLAQVCARQLLANPFKRKEEKRFVLLDRSANRAAKLLATKILQRFTIRRVCRERFETLKVKQTAMHLVGARLGDDVDDATSRAAEFGTGPSGHHLKFFYPFQRDVDGRALASQLFAEKAIVVIAAIKTDVIEHASLTSKSDFVAIGSLHHADARG